MVAGYGGGDVLQGVDIEIAQGAIACIVGPNGAGKSTVLRAVSGLLRPREGEVRARRQRPAPAAPRRRSSPPASSQVPQSDALFPNITVRENVLMGGYIIRRDRALVRQPLRRGRGAVPDRAPSARGDKAGNLSGGQRRMVEFARALMLDPQAGAARRAVARPRPEGAQARRRRASARMVEAGKTILLVEQNVRFGLRLATARHRDGERPGAARRAAPHEVLDNPEMADLYFGGSVKNAVQTRRPRRPA